MQFDIIDSLLENSTNIAPALVCKIMHKGAVVYQHATGNSTRTHFLICQGFLDPEERKTPVQLDSYFDFASLTKLFTTTAILKLIDNKTINSISDSGF
jgi:hypothetical protein